MRFHGEDDYPLAGRHGVKGLALQMFELEHAQAGDGDEVGAGPEATCRARGACCRRRLISWTKALLW